MDSLDIIVSDLQKLRIGQMEDFVYDSDNPVSDIVNYFKRDSKSYNREVEDGINVHRMIMVTDWKGGSKEVVTVAEEKGELLSIGIHGKGSRLITEFNTLLKVLNKLDKNPESISGFLGNRKGYDYYGNIMSNYIFGLAKDVQMSGDTVQMLVRNIYK
jgi:hypothetical protein